MKVNKVKQALKAGKVCIGSMVSSFRTPQIGPHDLSLSLGIVGQLKHPKMAEAYEKVIAACKKHGVAPGIHLTEADQAKEWPARGMRLFTFQNDVRMLMDAGKANTAQLREFISKKG